jgi:NitT/TauT family transport system ATP-binding protein
MADQAKRLSPKIAVQSVTKSFGSFVALDRLDLDVGAGEFFVIVGPSGCGKTTLLRILGGLERQSSGDVVLAEVDPGRPSNSIVFQGDSIFPWMNVFDNAAYGLRMRRRPERNVQEVVRPFLEKMGLWRFRRHYPHQLSGGMRQRVSIARAFANDPDILLMDEPFSALDETKKTVVFITHSVDEAVILGDRIMVMTAHPGRPKAIIGVPFPRPRHVLNLRATPEYGRLVFSIWEHLREEVQRARAQQEEEAA